MTESQWTTAFTIAALLLSGLAFLAWNSPPLFARFYGYLTAGIGVTVLVYWSFIAGANIALSAASGRVDANSRKAITAVQNDFALSGQLGWLAAFVTIGLLGLGWVAIHRHNEHRNAERKGEQPASTKTPPR